MNDAPNPPASPDAAQLDAQALARLRELDPDGRHGVVTRVMGVYETSLQDLMAQAMQAVSSGDATQIGHIAHKLKSSSAAIGALALSTLCADIERAVRNGAVPDLAAAVENLLAEGRRVLVAVRAMLRA